MSRTRVLVAAVVLLVSNRLASANDGGAWQPPLASLNLPRQEVGSARIGGFVYVCGGLVEVPFGSATDTVERYDIANDRWEFVASMPAARDHLGVAAAGGKLYVAGGFGGDFVAKSEAFVYDSATNIWSSIAPLPEPRGGCFAAEHGGLVYVFAGQSLSQNTRTTFIYDPATNSWTQGAEMTVARNHLVVVTLGDFIYALGGRPPVTSVNERYDPVRNEWRTMAPMPTARAAMAVAAVGNRIVVAGGETPVLHAVTEIYDVATNAWSCADAMPVPRHGIAAVSLGDRMLAPAGGVVQGFQPTAYTDAFIPPPERAPFLFAMKLESVEQARLLLERFDGRFFATITQGATTRCENVEVGIDGPGAASFLCGGIRVRIARDGGGALTWSAGPLFGTLCRL